MYHLKGNIHFKFLAIFSSIKHTTHILSKKMITFLVVVPLLYPIICLIEVWIGSYPAKLAEDMSKIFSANMWSIC